MTRVVFFSLAFFALMAGMVAAASFDGAGFTLERCTKCHEPVPICANFGKGEDFWRDIVKRMAGHGAVVDDSEQEQLTSFLSKSHSGDEVGELLGCGPNEESDLLPAVVLWIHPFFMVAAFVLSLFVLRSGIDRARFSLFKIHVKFDWRGHVRLGMVVCLAWLTGMAFGSFMTWLFFGSTGVTGTHAVVARIMFAMVLFGAGTGLYMDARKGVRKVLPLAHGINNLILVLLVLWQLVTGVEILKGFF